MSILEAIVLGVVQGLTEFLPVSSTAHLRVVPAFFGWEDPGAAYSAVIQTGTLVAVCLALRTDIAALLRGTLAAALAGRPLSTPEARLGWLIVLGTIPIVAAGLAGADRVGALEHHVFEEVADAGDPRPLVHAAHAGDPAGADDVGLVVAGHEQKLHAVGEGELLNLHLLGAGRGGERQKQGDGEREAEQAGIPGVSSRLYPSPALGGDPEKAQ
jgi:hypothetical protein